MIEPGIYTGTLQGIEVGASGKKKTPCVAIEWYIEEEDTYRTSYWYLSKKAKKNTFKKLKFVGFNGDFDNPECSLESAELRCKHEPYEDPETGDEEDREKWDLARWGGAGIDDADKKTVKDLNAQWKREMGAPAKKKKSMPPPPPEDEDDDPEPEEPEAAAEEEETPAPPPAKKKKKAAAKKDAGKTPRELAWDAFIEHKITEKALEMLEDGKSSKAVMEWTTLISEAVPDKEEEDFEASDWEAVQQYMETPF